MRQEKKVLLLILSLIVLIILCVYIHLEKIKNSESIVVEQELIKEPVKPQIQVEVQNEENPIVKDTIETNKENKEEKTLKEVLTEQVAELQTSIEEDTTDEAIEQNVKEEVLKEASTSTEEILSQTSTQEDTIDKVAEQDIKKETETQVTEEVQKEEPLITTNSKYIRKNDEKRVEELSKEVQLLQIKINNYIKENPIIFRSQSNKITKKSIKSIKTIVGILKEFPNIKIEIAGHTDAIGPKKLNQVISLERAKNVMNRLNSYGIDKNRMIVRGYGEDIPLVKNSPKGYSKINRRVEFNIVEE